MKKREIKFRAWDEQTNKMVYDFKNTDRGASLNEYGVLVRSCWHTIMQYTGLKDKNGVEIYEGDNILVHWLNYAPTSESISYDEKYGYWKYGNNPICELFDPEIRFEVIGNIYENPHLLEPQP